MSQWNALIWLSGGVAAALFITGLVTARLVRPKLDLVVRVGGLTLDEIKVMRKSLNGGRVPADPKLSAISIDYARQVAHNAPYQVRWLAFCVAGAVLFGVTLAIPSPDSSWTSWPFVVGLIVAFGYLLITVGRSWAGCRRVLAALEPRE